MRFFTRRKMMWSALFVFGVILLAVGIYGYPYWRGHQHVRHFKLERGQFNQDTLKPYRALVVKSDADLKDIVEGCKFAMRHRRGGFVNPHDHFWDEQCERLKDDIRTRNVDFVKETLILIPHTEGSGSIRVGLDWPHLKSKKLVLEIWRAVPFMCTCDMAYWCFAVIVPKAEVDQIEIRLEGKVLESLELASDPQEYLTEYRRLQKKTTARTGTMKLSPSPRLDFLTARGEDRPGVRIGIRFPYYKHDETLPGEPPPATLPAFQLTSFFTGATQTLPVIGPFGLDLSYSDVGDNDLREVAKLDQLQALDLSGTAITRVGLKNVAASKNLQALDLLRTNLRDEDIKALAEIRSLKQLSLAGTKITNAGLRNLAPLQELTTLCLGNCRIDDDGLKHLAALPRLQVLDLGSTDITDAGLKELQALTELSTLRIGAKRVTGASLKDLAQNRNLKSLTVRIHATSSPELAHLLHLEKLTLFHTGVSDDCLRAIGKLKNLRWLNLEGSRGISSIGIEALQNLNNLRTLNLADTGLGDAALEELAGFKQLKNLNVNRCSITDDGLKSLLSCKTLEVLDVGGTQVTDVGLKHLAGAKTLRILWPYHSRVTEKGIWDLQAALPDLWVVPQYFRD